MLPLDFQIILAEECKGFPLPRSLCGNHAASYAENSHSKFDLRTEHAKKKGVSIVNSCL